MLRALFVLGVFVIVGVVVPATIIYSQIAKEVRFRQTYGQNWRTEYEQAFGSVTRAHTRVAFGAVGIVAISVTGLWLVRILRKPSHAVPVEGGRRRKHRRHPHVTNLERTIRDRRNAFLGTYFGLAGIFAGACLAVFRFGIFADHSNEMALGMFVFLFGYSGVLAGCFWWLRAKSWNEAIVFIGLMPLGVLFIPYVRLIFLSVPSLLLVGMVMMPLILVVVTAVLPDQSGLSKRRRS